MSLNTNRQKETIKSCCPACSCDRIADKWPTSRIPGNKMVLWCYDCGLGWQHPLPSPSDIRYYYHRFPTYNIHGENEKEQGFMRRIQRISRLSPQGGRLLDIGSGLGVFLKLAMRNGWEAGGIEPQASAAEYCERNLGVKPYVGFIEDLAISPESFEVVTLWDVWEHIHAPLEFIDRCIDLLVPNGLLALSIPNASGYPARIFRGNWRYVMFTHLSYFTLSYVQRIMSQRNMHLLWADHTLKAQSLLQGVDTILPLNFNSERIIRLGRKSSSDGYGVSGHQQAGHSKRKVRLHFSLNPIRRLVLKANLCPLPISKGDMMDLYFKKGTAPAG
jgi:2-polyprenyl-3-methyl-5-hydroxy-6-metoxy-1,4-benzoquinol methylase